MLRASRDRSFHIPRPARDRVNLRQLAAIAGMCLSVGVALSGALQRPSHAAQSLHESAEKDVDWQEAAIATTPSVHALQAWVERAASAEVETSVSAALSAPPTAASPSPLAAAATSADRPRKRALRGASAREPSELDRALQPFKVALQRGAVSYRCDADARPTAKRSKCPHDRMLEARVWRVLSRLTSCRDATSTFGRAELRLRFAPDATTNPAFSAPTIAQSLNLRAVSKCVAAELSKLRSTRKVDRFELEIGFGLIGHN